MVKFSRKDENGYNQIFLSAGTTPKRTRRRNDWFIEELGAGKHVLEIGCGIGETAAYIATHSKANVIAIDISEMFIKEARQRYELKNLKFYCENFLDDGISRIGQFDMVMGNGILHHIVLDLERALISLHALTNSGGKLAFIEPNFLNPYCAFIFGTKIGRKFAKLDPNEMAFTVRELEKILPATGWQDVRVKTKDFLIPGLPVWTAKPIMALEPYLEANLLTRWLAQSHFISAKA